MEWLSGWHFNYSEIIAGALGGLCYVIFKDDFELPTKKGLKLYFGFLRAVFLGAFVAFIVNTHPVLCALMGFSFNDVILSMQRRLRKWLNGNENRENRNSADGGDKSVGKGI